MDRGQQKGRQPRAALAQPAHGLQAVEAGELRRHEREVEGRARGQQGLGLADGILAGHERVRRYVARLEPLGELVRDLALVLDDQDRRAAAVAELRQLAGRPPGGSESPNVSRNSGQAVRMASGVRDSIVSCCSMDGTHGSN